MKRLVADTGPILHLHQAGALHLLPLIGEVTLSPCVFGEIRRHAPQFWPAAMPAWVKPASPSADARQRALAWQQAGLLHRGEAEALAVACESRPDWFLTDDAAARLMAESLGMEAHGSLGVVLWTAARHLIGRQDAELFLTGLENSTLWLSPAVKVQARAALAAMFPAD